MRKLKVAWINDWYGSLGRSPDEEITAEFPHLQEDIGYAAELVASGRGMEIVVDKDVDLLVFDYGGASSTYSNTPWSQLEAACKWAHEHEGRLVLMYSSFTVRMYTNMIRAEADAHFRSDNILLYVPWSDGFDDVLEHIRSWFVGGDFEPYDAGEVDNA